MRFPVLPTAAALALSFLCGAQPANALDDEAYLDAMWCSVALEGEKRPGAAAAYTAATRIVDSYISRGLVSRAEAGEDAEYAAMGFWFDSTEQAERDIVSCIRDYRHR